MASLMFDKFKIQLLQCSESSELSAGTCPAGLSKRRSTVRCMSSWIEIGLDIEKEGRVGDVTPISIHGLNEMVTRALERQVTEDA